MNTGLTLRQALTVVLMGGLLLGCSDGSDDSLGEGNINAQCSDQITAALQACMLTSNQALGACYFDDNEPCQDNNPDLLEARNTLTSAVLNACSDGEVLGLSSQDLAQRMETACVSHTDALAWRSFGGPQGAVWPQADTQAKDCLRSAHETASAFVNDTLGEYNACLADAAACDTNATEENIAQAQEAAVTAISDACPALEDVIAVSPQQYLENTHDHIQCTVAAAYADVAPLSLNCGPGNVEVFPPRGEWTQIILDSDKWGSMCGDGSDYAIQIRPAPEGEPIDRVLIGLQGGGVCLFAGDCAARFAGNPGLFNAQDDLPLGAGIASDDPDNPFANWTKVYLPYCNQDVFIGGGVLEDFGDLQVPRYGTINLRAGMRVVRDIVWKYMDETSPQGFRPDELIALFGGFSAGGYGALYNYHWVLDDLLWPRTAAYPDAGGALDNGEVAGVRGLGFVKIPIWGAKPYLPPYCFSGDCAVGPDNYVAISPRLKQVPEQQYLILSNQKDNTQQGDAFFSDEAQWIDAMRAAYCDTKDLPGIQWYLTSDSENSVHVVSVRDEFYYGEVAGERMVDWFWRAVTDPDSIEDRAEEGNFTTDIPGSNPFPCELPN